MSVIYLTSFNRNLYNFTGIKLLQSFIKTKSEGVLFFTYEGLSKLELPNWLNNVSGFSLDSYIFLHDFLLKHESLIPEQLGGLAKPCNCNDNPIQMAKDKYHNKGCYFHYWNRNFSRWFRKIASFKYILDIYPILEYLIWIDCDCIFKKSVSESWIISQFHNNACFYFKGSKRKVEETGIMGFSGREGRKFLLRMIERYTLDLFYNDPRWDDSYQFQATRLSTKIPCIDLAIKAKTSNPIPETSFAQYITHNKGVHGRAMLI